MVMFNAIRVIRRACLRIHSKKNKRNGGPQKMKNFSAITVAIVFVLIALTLSSCRQHSKDADVDADTETITNIYEEDKTETIQIYNENFSNMDHETRRERFGEYLGEKLFFKRVENKPFGILTYLQAEKAVSVIVNHSWQNVKIAGKVRMPRGEDCILISVYEGYQQFWSIEISNDTPTFFKVERKVFGSDDKRSPIGVTPIQGALLFLNFNEHCIELISKDDNNISIVLDKASLPGAENVSIEGVIENKYYEKNPYSYRYLIKVNTVPEKLYVVWVDNDKIVVESIDEES